LGHWPVIDYTTILVERQEALNSKTGNDDLAKISVGEGAQVLMYVPLIVR
jgi:hypothetical protein